MNKRVPEDWSLTTVGRVCDTVYRYPTFYGMETYSNGIPVLRGEHLLNNGKISQNWNDYTYVLEEFSNKYPKTKLELGDVVMAVRGTVGKFSKVDKLHVNAQISPNLIRLAPNKDIVDSDFFFQSLFSVKDSLLQVSVSATGVPALNSSDINASLITLPPLPEQKKIASILTSVDEVIEKTQLQINKLQDLKKGTMNELLTKGIGHTEFKDSELGRIPKSWITTKLDECSVFIRDGTHGTHVRIKNGIPLLSAKNITASGNLVWGKEDSFISEADYNQIHSRYIIEQDDVLLTVVGTLGRVAVVTKNNDKFTVQRSVAIIRTNKELLLPDFCFQYLRCHVFQNQLVIRSNSTAQAGVYLGELGKIKLSIPSLLEQKKIVSILTSMDKNIEVNKEKLSQTQSLKKSLMQDLLTGKKRVTVN